MNRVFFHFAFLLFTAIFYEAAANVPHHRQNRHHRQLDASACIPTYGGALCHNDRNYPFERINDVVNEVRVILSTRPQDETRLREIDPEVLNFQADPSDVAIQNLPEQVDGCQTELQEIYPHEGVTSSSGRRQNFFIVNIPSLRQGVVTVRCNCQNSVHNSNCKRTYRQERLLALPGDKTHFQVSDFSIETFFIPEGCPCSS